MAAKVSDRLWSMDDIAALVDATAPAPGKRGPYKKQVVERWLCTRAQMKGLPRALFFGGGWSFGLFAIGLLVGLPEAAQNNREAVIFGFGSAILSVLVFWTATRIATIPSWPIAIIGWIGGFFLLPGLVRVLFAIADLIISMISN